MQQESAVYAKVEFPRTHIMPFRAGGVAPASCNRTRARCFRWQQVHPAPLPNDRRQTGLLTRRIAAPAPPSHGRMGRSGIMEQALPGHSCGGSAGFS